MRLTVLKNYFLIGILFLLIIACNAPHNNPLDPENPNKKITSIQGIVKSIKVPQNPITNAKVFWENDGLITYTNKTGNFYLTNIERNNGWLTIEKENYTTDSTYINFNDQKTISKSIFLNSMPIINKLDFFSITVNKFPAKQDYYLEINTNITDIENDVDSVFIENLELDANIELLYNATTKQYERNNISLSDLNVVSIDNVIGKEFIINVKDVSAKKFLIGNSNIKRIIKKEIETTFPLGRDTVWNANPKLEWVRFTPGFNFKYLLEIYTDEVPATLVWQKEISSDNIEFQTDANLNSGDYFWFIWAIDEFNNKTRSKASSFIIM